MVEPFGLFLRASACSVSMKRFPLHSPVEQDQWLHLLGHDRLDVLIVDDDESFVNVLAEQLSKEFGHRAAVARDGTSALAELHQGVRRFHIVLLDYEMPEMDGLEVLRRMTAAGHDTPVVMLTAAGSEDTAVGAMKLGAYDYVRKEQLDLVHLDLLLEATHERHLFRIAEAIELERSRQIRLNDETTDSLRDVVNAITPTLNSALAHITGDLEALERYSRQGLPEEGQTAVAELLTDLRREIFVLESGVAAVLNLSHLLYAHHGRRADIELIRREYEAKLRSVGEVLPRANEG
jgi:CheY-like chemotaxis protein